MTRRPIAAQVAASLCAVLFLVACAAGGSNSSPSAAGGVAVVLANSSAGEHLAGPNGHALYVFKTDSANTSTCTDTCAQNWPPLTVAAGTTPSATGVAAHLGTITRSDGSLQVTANGMPLYYFAGDASATDINGQGKNGVWFLAATDGSPLTGPDMSPAASPKSSDDGYY
jgi:predicted lipoprotein with Yx(FWY)xxD motif